MRTSVSKLIALIRISTFGFRFSSRNWKILLVCFVHCTIKLMCSLWLFHLVEVKSGADGFVIKMRDGRHLRCVHNNPQGGHLPDYAPHPAIVLKMEDGTGLLLPIIVCTCI